MIIIGLTGGSGSGKSTVAKIFSLYNVFIIDADKVYGDLTSKASPCLNELAEKFGYGIVSEDGSLNRGYLREIVFSDSEKLKTLNSIAHRHVIMKIRSIIKELSSEDYDAVIVDAPQLFESGYNKECNVIISVISDRHHRIARIVERDKITVEDAEKRLNNQLPDDFFRENSDFVIENNTTQEALMSVVKNIIDKIKIKYK